MLPDPPRFPLFISRLLFSHQLSTSNFIETPGSCRNAQFAIQTKSSLECRAAAPDYSLLLNDKIILAPVTVEPYKHTVCNLILFSCMICNADEVMFRDILVHVVPGKCTSLLLLLIWLVLIRCPLSLVA